MNTINVERANAYPGYAYMDTELIENGDFSNEDISPWNFSAVGVKGEGEVNEGTYKVTIDNVTEKSRDDRWQAQLSQKNLSLEAGVTYNVSFTVTADHDCEIYPFIGDQGDPYDEYWNCQGTLNNGGKTWMPIEIKAGETKTIKGSFRMNKSVDECMLAFNLAGDCAPEEDEAYSYTFSDISLEGSIFRY